MNSPDVKVNNRWILYGFLSYDVEKPPKTFPYFTPKHTLCFSRTRLFEAKIKRSAWREGNGSRNSVTMPNVYDVNMPNVYDVNMLCL